MATGAWAGVSGGLMAAGAGGCTSPTGGDATIGWLAMGVERGGGAGVSSGGPTVRA